MTDDSLGSLSREDFAARLGETFAVTFDDAPAIELELAEVNATGGDSDHREPFSLIFLGPPEPILDQAIYALANDALGSLHLFLVPLGPDTSRDHIQYEAVFS